MPIRFSSGSPQQPLPAGSARARLNLRWDAGREWAGRWTGVGFAGGRQCGCKRAREDQEGSSRLLQTGHIGVGEIASHTHVSGRGTRTLKVFSLPTLSLPSGSCVFRAFVLPLDSISVLQSVSTLLSPEASLVSHTSRLCGWARGLSI